MPGLFSYHNNKPFSAYDQDNDAYPTNCAERYAQAPFWYDQWWWGSIFGGGEDEGEGYFNGAYWVDDIYAWGTDDGAGAGNGWMFVK